jgi:hypothetical protein
VNSPFVQGKVTVQVLSNVTFATTNRKGTPVWQYAKCFKGSICAEASAGFVKSRKAILYELGIN